MFGTAFRLRRDALERNGTIAGRGISSGRLVTRVGARSGFGLGFGVLARAEISKYLHTESAYVS